MSAMTATIALAVAIVMVSIGARSQVVTINPQAPPSAPQEISGVVTDSSGAPVEGVTVTLIPNIAARGPVRTDSQGRYSLVWQPINRAGRGGPAVDTYLVARAPDRNQVAFQRIDGQTSTKDLQLASGLTLSGVVQDQYGAPVSTATVQLVVLLGNMGSPLDSQPIRLDSQGKFSVAGVPQGSRLNLQVRANDHRPATRQLQEAETAVSELALAPIVLNLADQLVAGTVVNDDNKPVAGALVRCLSADQPNTITRADASGHFELKVCAGRIQLAAFEPNTTITGQINSTIVQSGDTTVTLKISKPQPNAARGATTARTTVAGNRAVLRNGQFKPQVMTIDALKFWTRTHRSVFISLGIFQGIVLLAVGGGIFWVVRPERPPADDTPAGPAVDSNERTTI